MFIVSPDCQIFSGGFLYFFGGIGKCNLDLVRSSTARYRCIYLKWDGKCVVSSLNVLGTFFKYDLFKEAMLVQYYWEGCLKDFYLIRI